MARYRSIGWQARGIGRIRDLYREGLTRQEVVDDMLTNFPLADRRWLDRTADRELDRFDRLKRVLRSNFGQYQDLGSLLRCPHGYQGIRTHVVLSWEDPHTRLSQSFAQEVVVLGGNRVGEVLKEAVAKALVEAFRKGYNPPAEAHVFKVPGEGELPGLGLGVAAEARQFPAQHATVDLRYVDCI